MNIDRVSVPLDWIADPGDHDAPDSMPIATAVQRFIYLAADSVAEAGIAVAQRRAALAEFDRVLARSRAGEGTSFGGVELLAARLASKSYALSVSNANLAVDRIVTHVEAASYDQNIKRQVRSAADQLFHAIPWAKDVRDTYAHMEERVLGLRHGDPIQNQPVDIAGSVKIAGGTVGNFIEMSDRDGFSVTLGDGGHAQVAVTEDAARQLRDLVQLVIDSLPWKSPDRSMRRPHPAD